MMVVGVKHLKQKSRNGEIRVIHTLNKVHSQHRVSEYEQDAPVAVSRIREMQMSAPQPAHFLRCATHRRMYEEPQYIRESDHA